MDAKSSAINRIQAAARGHRARLQAAVMKVQMNMLKDKLSGLVRMRQARGKRETLEKERLSLVTIQSRLRGWFARRRVKREVEKREKAVVTIQRHYRGRSARKLMKSCHLLSTAVAVDGENGGAKSFAKYRPLLEKIYSLFGLRSSTSFIVTKDGRVLDKNSIDTAGCIYETQVILTQNSVEEIFQVYDLYPSVLSVSQLHAAFLQASQEPDDESYHILFPLEQDADDVRRLLKSASSIGAVHDPRRERLKAKAMGVRFVTFYQFLSLLWNCEVLARSQLGMDGLMLSLPDFVVVKKMRLEDPRLCLNTALARSSMSGEMQMAKEDSSTSRSEVEFASNLARIQKEAEKLIAKHEPSIKKVFDFLLQEYRGRKREQFLKQKAQNIIDEENSSVRESNGSNESELSLEEESNFDEKSIVAIDLKMFKDFAVAFQICPRLTTRSRLQYAFNIASGMSDDDNDDSLMCLAEFKEAMKMVALNCTAPSENPVEKVEHFLEITGLADADSLEDNLNAINDKLLSFRTSSAASKHAFNKIKQVFKSAVKNDYKSSIDAFGYILKEIFKEYTTIFENQPKWLNYRLFQKFTRDFGLFPKHLTKEEVVTISAQHDSREPCCHLLPSPSPVYSLFFFSLPSLPHCSHLSPAYPHSALAYPTRIAHVHSPV
mmetsp:Transcript_5869/g.13915  ORF Transcript_5869/g.13915 Transcript_5869/m.13915 type:complete len:661 (-) Transcript_5869:2981-4963(-)